MSDEKVDKLNKSIHNFQAQDEKVDWLNKSIRNFQAQDQRRNNLNLVIRIMAALFVLMLIAFSIISSNELDIQASYESYLSYILPRLGFSAAILAFIFFITKSSNFNKVVIQDARNELALLSTDIESSESRAELLFKNHEFELKKYYDQTLAQAGWIFKTGIACIFLGFVIIGVTFQLIGSGEDSEKIITAVVGSIGVISTNFIGVIYIKMYSESMKALTGFHNRLVSTHHLHYANFMGSKIKDEKLREKTISEISIALANPNNTINKDI